mgnify:CR=1 FL=1
MRLFYSRHAMERMFQRAISPATVERIVRKNHVVAEYPDDQPYPSCLLLGFDGARPIHVVVGYDRKRDEAYIVTVYEPDREAWSDDFSKRRK